MLHKSPLERNSNENKTIATHLVSHLGSARTSFEETPPVLEPRRLSHLIFETYVGAPTKASQSLVEEDRRHMVGIREFGALKNHVVRKLLSTRGPRLRAPRTRLSYFHFQERVVGLGGGLGYGVSVSEASYTTCGLLE